MFVVVSAANKYLNRMKFLTGVMKIILKAQLLFTLCPICYIDAVIGSKSGYPVDEQEFLEEMNEHWLS